MTNLPAELTVPVGTAIADPDAMVDVPSGIVAVVETVVVTPVGVPALQVGALAPVQSPKADHVLASAANPNERARNKHTCLTSCVAVRRRLPAVSG